MTATQEIDDMSNGISNEESSVSMILQTEIDELPETFDWRNKDGENWMTPVKNQGRYGGCWAFSAIGVVESAVKIYANNSTINVDLSEQHLLSGCCSAGSCYGE